MNPVVNLNSAARTAAYPESPAERTRWIMSRRGPRNAVDPWKPHAFFTEEERDKDGRMVGVASVFLTNRECPWHCLMCDLWKNTLTGPVPRGAIPAQIDHALGRLAGTAHSLSHIKLYNSGSFFDPQAIPVEDHPAIAQRVSRFERVIVECHPVLVDDRCARFRDLLGGEPGAGRTATLEVAMGLETAHPDVLARLNKRMTLDDFARAAERLGRASIALRAFILVKPPFLDEAMAFEWACRSIEFAFDHGASVVSLIPVRAGNGALEDLSLQGGFAPPRMKLLEQALEYGIKLGRGRAFADLWDLERFAGCAGCFEARRSRLDEMNRRQEVQPPLVCPRCEL